MVSQRYFRTVKCQNIGFFSFDVYFIGKVAILYIILWPFLLSTGHELFSNLAFLADDLEQLNATHVSPENLQNSLRPNGQSQFRRNDRFFESESHEVQTNNRSLEIDYCDLAFINDSDKKELISNYIIADDTSVDKEAESRKIRALPKVYTIETAIFVDKSLAQRFEGKSEELKRLVMAIMDEVQLIYEYSSMKMRIKIVVVKLEVLSRQGPDPADGDIDKYLDNFCAWQARQYRQENWSSRWDHALMLTGLDLFKDMGNGKRNKKVLGLAWVNGMCKPTYSCTLNEGKSFEAAFVIAHELGHSLGILHDGRGNNCDPEKYIMSEKTGPGKVNWSPCSNVYINNFMSRGNGQCLENMAMSSTDLEFRLSNRLPGERFPANVQCQLALGSDYKAYITNKEPFRSICRELWCISGSWATPAHPALEGSQCSSSGERCFQGDCSSAYVRDAIAQQSGHLTKSGVNVNRPTAPGSRWRNRNRQGVRNRGRPHPIRFTNRRNAVSASAEQVEARLEERSTENSVNKTKTTSPSTSPSPQAVASSKSSSLLQSIRNGIKSFADSAKKFWWKLFS